MKRRRDGKQLEAEINDGSFFPKNSYSENTHTTQSRLTFAQCPKVRYDISDLDALAI